MKLFGGGGSRTGNGNSEPEKPKAGVAPKPSGKKGGKVPKKPLSKAQKRKRVVISLCVVALIAATIATAAYVFIRPPEIKNNPTIKDTENGDAIDVNGLLNSGERISDLFTFVVCATDEDQTRTDAIMAVSFDTKKKTISIMNIPRDTMSNVSRIGAARKINAAYGMRKGIEQTKAEVEKLMGFVPDKYIVVNFDGIAEIVDAIGGVDYEVPFRMEYDDPSQNLHIDLYAGMQKLNGKQTVEFLRWRHNNDYSVQYPNGDEGRVENQQKFLKKLASDVFQMSNITKIKPIADAVFKNVKTDFTAGELLWLGMQAMQVKNSNIRMFTLPGYGAMSTAGGDPTPYSFYFPYEQETLTLVNQYFNPFSTPIQYLDMVKGPESYSSGGGGGGSSSSGNSSENYVWGDSNKKPAVDTPDTGDTAGGGSTDSGTTDGTGGSTGNGTDGGAGGSTDGSTGNGSGNTGGSTDNGTGGSGGNGSGGNTGGSTDNGAGSGGTGGSTDSGSSGGSAGGDSGSTGGGTDSGSSGGGTSGGSGDSGGGTSGGGSDSGSSGGGASADPEA